LGGALEARKIAAADGRLTAVAFGDVEVDEGVLVLRRIHVVFTLAGVADDAVPVAERVHDVFKPKCPVYRSLYRAIEITTALHVSTAPTPPG
jgi:uncharacterized OsmC-like protein